jgi:hypothetical protein
MNPKDPWAPTMVAWFRATCPDDKARNGKDALKLALDANKRWEAFEPPRQTC